MAAIQARRTKENDEGESQDRPSRPINPLLAAIQARGKVEEDRVAFEQERGRPSLMMNPLLAAIQARQKRDDDSR
jgi:hypothetical protein